MKPRLNIYENTRNALKGLYAMGTQLKNTALEKGLLELVYFRVSQINGCAYCLDMHSKDARAAGETEQRLYGLAAWREAPYYSERERAAFNWAEAVTACKVPDDAYEDVSRFFSENELVDLTLAITHINTWNRINIAFPHNIGTYAVGQFG